MEEISYLIFREGRDNIFTSNKNVRDISLPLIFSLIYFTVGVTLYQFNILRDDEFSYLTRGKAVLENFQHGSEDFWHINAYSNFVSIFFYIFGSNILILRAISSLSYAIGGYYLLKIFQYFFSKSKASKLFVGISLLPSAFYCFSFGMKEGILFTGFSLVVYGILTKKLSHELLGIFALTMFRKEYGAVVILWRLAVWIAEKIHTKRATYTVTSFIFIMLIEGGFAVYSFHGEENKLVHQITSERSRESWNKQVITPNKESILYRLLDKDFRLSPKNILITEAHSLLSPNPLIFLRYKNTQSFILGILISPFLLVAFPFFLISAIKGFEKRNYDILFVFSLVFLFWGMTGVLTLTNYPNPFRFRQSLQPFFFFLAFFGFINAAKKDHYKITAPWAAAVSIYFIIYTKIAF